MLGMIATIIVLKKNHKRTALAMYLVSLASLLIPVLFYKNDVSLRPLQCWPMLAYALWLGKKDPEEPEKPEALPENTAEGAAEEPEEEAEVTPQE